MLVELEQSVQLVELLVGFVQLLVFDFEPVVFQLELIVFGLERDGLLTRTVTPSIPPRVDYELTELGISLREPVKALGDWAIEHIACIRAAQEKFDAIADARLT